MIVTFYPDAWADYAGWLEADTALVRKINGLIQDARRAPFKGLGKPEPLKGDLKGWWSRRITAEHRLVYRIAGQASDKSQRIEIIQCRLHY